MNPAVVAVGALLASVAAAGVLWPYLVRRPLPDGEDWEPAGDGRRRSLAELNELEEERLVGAFEEQEYGQLRASAEARAVAALRVADAPRAAVVVPVDGRQPGDGAVARPRPPSLRRILPALVAGLLLAALVAPLAGALRSRTPGEPFTGSSSGRLPLALMEQRVRDHPLDLAARLDLAERYLEEGDGGAAIEQYVAALRIDPESAEAHARLGALLFQAGRPEEALRAVDRALEADPTYPEALYFRGVILLRGLDRPGAAEEAFRSYLEAAPFGSRRDEVRALLDRLGGG